MEEDSKPKVEEKVQTSGGLAKLTAEQLLEYVKKQNVKMKKLKSENDGLQKTIAELNSTIEEMKSRPTPKTEATSVVASTDASSYDLFWELIERRPSWQQNLAKVSLQYLVDNVSKLNPLISNSTAVRHAFSKWMLVCQGAKTASVEARLEETKKNNSFLEQRCCNSSPLYSLQT